MNVGLALLCLTLVLVGLFAGFQSVEHSQYRSAEAVFEDFLIGPIRLALPVVAALVASAGTVHEMSQRYVLCTRTRIDVRRMIRRNFAKRSLVLFPVFASIVPLSGFAAFVLVPALYPDAISPASYGSFASDSDVFRQDVADAPLAYFLNFGIVPFLIAASLWLGLNAVLFGLVGVLGAYWIQRPVLVFLLPFAVYFAESVVFQLASLPGYAFLISAVFPAGLQNYDPRQAVIPTAALAVCVAAAMLVTVARAPHSPRFS